MTQDEIIEMARQADIESNQYMIYEALAHTAFVCSIQELETFAKLVAAKEREACAKVCEELQPPPDWSLVAVLWKECRNKLAQATRARGEA